MGALNGTISYTLFHVEGDSPEPFRDTVTERLGAFAFEELRPDSDEDFSVGWCVVGDLLDTKFTRESLFFEPYVCFSMRTDRWALPATLLKALTKRREEERMAERQTTRLSRAEKEQIREEVARGLKEQMLPSAGTIDVVWNPDARMVRFWSQATARVEVFQELFEATFGLRLIESGAYVEALHGDLDPDTIGLLATAEVSSFGQPERS